MESERSINIENIPENECTPTVILLLSLIESLQSQLAKQSEQLDTLISELKRLKKLKEKPKLKASKLPKNSDDDSEPPTGGTADKKRAGSKKKRKNALLKITHEEIIRAKDVPVGAVHKGYKDFIIQELIIEAKVVKYRLERWQLLNGDYYTAELPASLSGQHFGPTLRAYVLHQYHHQGVTQPLLYGQLKELKFDLSKGQLNRLLIENKEKFHEEKASILKSGLSVSQHINVDDTGARHQGTNGYCTHIGNELFAWFESTRRKSRINFLQLLQNGKNEYCLTKDSFRYMKRYKVPPWIQNKLKAYRKKVLTEESWVACLARLGITNAHYKRLVTEAALIGSLLKEGFSKEMVIVSDDAGQFNVFQHALCWIHAERGVTSLIPDNDIQVKAIEWARQQIWDIYHELIEYKKNPNKKLKNQITKQFDKFCKTRTDYQTLNLALKRFRANKDELLMVLKRPDIPIHNNLSERDIREYVKRRKISGSTRSDEGRRCRDTFASLKKTALKLGIGFWDYLIDRVNLDKQVPPLSFLIEEAAQN